MGEHNMYLNTSRVSHTVLMLYALRVLGKPLAGTGRKKINARTYTNSLSTFFKLQYSLSNTIIGTQYFVVLLGTTDLVWPSLRYNT